MWEISKNIRWNIVSSTNSITDLNNVVMEEGPQLTLPKINWGSYSHISPIGAETLEIKLRMSESTMHLD